jgi:transposase
MSATNQVKSMSREQRLGFRQVAHTMWSEGLRAPTIAARIGVNRSTVQRWTKTFAANPATHARAEAKRGPKAGSMAALTPADAVKIQRLIMDKTPDQLKFNFALWTSEAVRDLAAHRFGVKLTRRSIRRYLRAWGFTPQRPQKAARERDDAAVRRWLEEEYPRIKKLARRAKAEIYWADESCVKASEQKPRGYAPAGKTPVFKAVANQGCKAGMISAVSNNGKVRFMMLDTAIHVALFKCFLARLMKDAGRPVFVIVDNLKVHHAKALQPWLKKHRSRLRLFYLPSYSPDLNPDEYLNQDVKQAVNKLPGARHSSQLKGVVRAHLCKRARQPHIVRRFFQHPQIIYAAKTSRKLCPR